MPKRYVVLEPRLRCELLRINRTDEEVCSRDYYALGTFLEGTDKCVTTQPTGFGAARCSKYELPELVAASQQGNELEGVSAGAIYRGGPVEVRSGDAACGADFA